MQPRNQPMLQRNDVIDFQPESASLLIDDPYLLRFAPRQNSLHDLATGCLELPLDVAILIPVLLGPALRALKRSLPLHWLAVIHAFTRVDVVTVQTAVLCIISSKTFGCRCACGALACIYSDAILCVRSPHPDRLARLALITQTVLFSSIRKKLRARLFLSAHATDLHQSSVMLDPVVTDGVTFCPKFIVGDSAP